MKCCFLIYQHLGKAECHFSYFTRHNIAVISYAGAILSLLFTKMIRISWKEFRDFHFAFFCVCFKYDIIWLTIESWISFMKSFRNSLSLKNHVLYRPCICIALDLVTLDGKLNKNFNFMKNSSTWNVWAFFHKTGKSQGKMQAKKLETVLWSSYLEG